MSKIIDADPVLTRLMQALREAFKRKGILRKGDMADYLGYKGPYFSGVINGRERLTDAFMNQIEKKLGINPEWVLQGDGDMLGQITEEGFMQCRVVPVVPLFAHGGSLIDFNPPVDGSSCTEFVASPLRDVDYAITVAGDSMAPDFPNGSLVLIKKIDSDAFIEWGKPFVLDTCNGIVIKILTPSEDPDRVRCVSLNQDSIFAPFEIEKSDIYGIYAVRFSMSRR